MKFPKITLKKVVKVHEHEKFLVDHYLEVAEKLISKKISADEFALEQAKKILELESRADHDGLITTFLNNHGFFENVRREMSTMKRFNSLNGVLMFIDIDNFKRFNDTFGHPSGDKLIKIFAEVIEKNTRVNDIKGRVGGDEFAVFLIGTDLQNAKIVAERIRDDIIKESKIGFNELEWNQTTSIGLAQIDTEYNLEILRENADKALYKAKENKNQTILFTSELF